MLTIEQALALGGIIVIACYLLGFLVEQYAYDRINSVKSFINYITGKSLKWDFGAPKPFDLDFQQTILNRGFDPAKRILYIPAGMIAVWISDSQIVNSVLRENTRECLSQLAPRYNLVLYLPEGIGEKIDQQVNMRNFPKIENIGFALGYINKEMLPICCIVRKLPCTKVTTPFMINVSGEPFWFIEYVGRKHVCR